MDKEYLQKLYEETHSELESQRDRLDGIYHEKMALCQPVTDDDIAQQKDACADLSLKLSEIKKALGELKE